MTHSYGFGKEDAFSVFESLRPEAGETIEQIDVATYSLDLVAVAALILSLSAAGEEELDAGPLSFLDAFKKYAPHTRIYYQEDRLSVPKRHFGILHSMDSMLRPVPRLPRSSFHPKMILVRYSTAKSNSLWRLWLGSRNMTGGLDREAGIMLTGVPGKAGSRADVSDAVLDLLREANWPPTVQAQIRAIKWQAPTDTKIRRLHWRKQGALKTFISTLPGETDTLAISPFVDLGGIELLSLGKNSRLRLLTTEMTAARIGKTVAHIRTVRHPTYGEPIDLAAAGGTVEGEAPVKIEMNQTGLHAKLILKRSKSLNRLWIGSANVTSRGLRGPNAEMMLELDVPDTIATELASFWDLGNEPTQTEIDPDTIMIEKEERALDEALLAVLGASLQLSLRGDDILLSSADSFDEFLNRYDLSSWLCTRPTSTVVWRPGSTAIRLTDGGLPIRDWTQLVCFRAVLRDDTRVSREWTQKVSFPSLDIHARDVAAQATYIGGKFREWLTGQLEGIRDSEHRTWDGREKSSSHSHWSGDDVPVLAIEKVLAAWAKNPYEFERKAAEMVEVIRSFEAEATDSELQENDRTQLRNDLDAILPFWRALEECLNLGKRRGA
ncbi:hypothetical protein [Rhizobium leguminosarum]|uniref:hypothetical protein n=1 Tax=Rhizobium leguminosarum TaxID=384 RepID=UPI0014411694|nr:hypothetical protein [Rhizobium leguminosarum]MBY2950947.1 hypothetical protein [Rhizobium leguminosarum]NKL66277.1 hypothetical protein [Rhizobium leguminosarum bv. viciae]